MKNKIVIEQNFLERTSQWDKEKIQLAYQRLTPHIEEFKYLAKIKDWISIKDKPEIYIKLQEAYDIMISNEIKQHGTRCKPCERMALCAIKDIVDNNDFVSMKFKPEKEVWEIEKDLQELQISNEVIEECKVKEKKFLERRYNFYKNR